MKNTTLILIGLALVGTLACKKKGKENTIETVVSNTAFQFYTSTDATGNLTGLTDPTDWTFDQDWNAQERSLFSGYETLKHVQDTSIHMAPMYPNPFVTQLLMHCNKQADVRVQVRFVNTEYAKIQSFDSIMATDNMFDFSANSLTSGKMIRAYYMFVRNDTCFYKGHGDLKVQ